MNKIEEIQKLKSLLDQGSITQDEFNILKRNVLEDGNLATKQNSEIPAHKEVSTHQAIIGDINESQSKKKLKAIIVWGLIGFLMVMYYIGSHDSPSYNSSSSSGDDRAVLYCNFCKKYVVAENGKDLIYYTNEVDGCAVHAVNSGKYDAFCSPQCCKAWRSAMQ